MGIGKGTELAESVARVLVDIWRPSKLQIVIFSSAEIQITGHVTASIPNESAVEHSGV